MTMRRFVILLLVFALVFGVAAHGEGSLSCDTAFNGCVGLPLSWVVESDDEIVKYELFCDGASVLELETGDDLFTYTPAKGGQYLLICTLDSGETLQSSEITVADKLLMGTYEQDGKEDNGEEPIEWSVLGIDGGKALVISKHILHNAGYFNPWWIKYKYTYWAHSYISDFNVNYWGSQPEDPSRRFTVSGSNDIPMEDRTRGSEEDLYNSELHCRYWCNSIFYADAFEEDERARILLSHNTNPDNPESRVKGGPDTDDYVFFLSYEELMKYMPTADSRKTTQTQAALNEGRNNTAQYWWLRTPGKFRVNAVIVYGNNGHVTLYGTDVGHDAVGYRPCMWITIGG